MWVLSFGLWVRRVSGQGVGFTTSCSALVNTVVFGFLRFEVWFGARRVHINLLGHLHVQEFRR